MRTAITDRTPTAATIDPDISSLHSLYSLVNVPEQPLETQPGSVLLLQVLFLDVFELRYH
jgi:hypothetical protein